MGDMEKKEVNFAAEGDSLKHFGDMSLPLRSDKADAQWRLLGEADDILRDEGACRLKVDVESMLRSQILLVSPSPPWILKMFGGSVLLSPRKNFEAINARDNDLYFG